MTLTVMRASQDQRARTKAEEGLRLAAYNDTVGISTIGWGHASVNPHPVRGLLNGEFYQGKPKAGVTITIQEAERLFDLDIDEIETGVSALVKQELSQSQFDALVDFCFQYGLDKFGTSDLVDKLNFNPNNTDAVFFQFMRWTRAGGDHQEYVWRRSARRCCIYNGSPIPQALWRKNGFPFATKKNEDGQIVIDYTITPTIEKIIAYGKKAAEKPVFDPSKPLPEAPPIEPLKPEVILAPKLPIPEELVLTIPAASDSGPDANGAELVRPDLPDVQAPKAEENTNSTGVLVGSAERLDPIAPQPPVALPSPLPPVSSAPSAPIGKPKDPPPVIAGQDGAKPKSPWTVQPEEVHYKIDPGAGLKPLEDSDRAKAFYWQRSFMFIIYLGGAGVFGSTFMAGSEVLMKHAALMSVLLDLIVPLAIAASGLLVGAVGKSWADWRRHCAQEKASQGLY